MVAGGCTYDVWRWVQQQPARGGGWFWRPCRATPWDGSRGASSGGSRGCSMRQEQRLLVPATTQAAARTSAVRAMWPDWFRRMWPDGDYTSSERRNWRFWRRAFKARWSSHTWFSVWFGSNVFFSLVWACTSFLVNACSGRGSWIESQLFLFGWCVIVGWVGDGCRLWAVLISDGMRSRGGGIGRTITTTADSPLIVEIFFYLDY